MKKLGFVLTFICCMVYLVGCNTLRGIGTDIKRGGEAIERAGK